MTLYNRQVVCFCIRANPDDDPNVNDVHIVTGAYATQTQARIRINAGADVIENEWFQSTDTAILYTGADISETTAWNHIKTAMGGNNFATSLANWRVSVYSISTATDSPGEPNTGTAVYGLDDARYVDLGTDNATRDAAILTSIQAVRDATHNQTFVSLSWVDDSLEDTNGESSWEDALIKYRWCDATDELSVGLPNGEWYVLATTVATFQAALDLIAAMHPTKGYDAAYATVGSCQEVIVRYNPSGTPGTITFDQGFQDLIEDNGTWLAPMRVGVDYSKWV